MAKAAPKEKDLISDAGFTRVSMLAGIPLGDHDGLPITQSTASIHGLEGGFAETAALDKIHVPVRNRVIGIIVLEAESHEYDRIKEGRGKDAEILEEFVENTVYKGESLFLIDPDDLQDLVLKHQARVTEARVEAERLAQEAKGVSQFPIFGGGDGEQKPGGDGDSTDGEGPKLRSVKDEKYFDAERDPADAPNPLVPSTAESVES
jgi:hypothetical protein